MGCIGSYTSCQRGNSTQFDNSLPSQIQEKLGEIETNARALLSYSCVLDAHEELARLESELKSMLTDPAQKAFFNGCYALGSHQLSDVQTAIKEVHWHLDQREPEAKIEQKWLDLGFPRDWLQKDPEAVHFIANTGALLSILTLQNSTDLENPQPLLRLENGDIEVLVQQGNQSQYMPVRDFKEKVKYDEKDDVFVDKSGEHGWNMTQWGFAPQGRFDGLEAFAQITPQAQAKLLAHGKTYWSPEQQLDKKGNERTCTIQLTTSYKPRMGLPRSGLTKNIVETFNHVGLRIIDADGKVFSTGHEMTADQNQAVFGSPTTLLASAHAKGSWPDFDDIRPFEERHVTTVAISAEEFEKIKEYIAGTKNSRFNTVKQNCAKQVCGAFKEAGIDIPLFQDAYDYISDAMPSLDAVPVIGKPLAKVAAVISTIAHSIFKALKWITPNCIQRPIRAVKNTITTVYINIWMLIFGAAKMTPRDPNIQEDVFDKRRMSSFSRMFRSFKDLFNPKLRQFASTKKVMNWQKAQNTTAIHLDGKKSRLCILPPQL